MVADEMKSAYHRAKWALLIRGLISVAIAILIVARPIASIAALALVIAIWALVDGIVRIAHAVEMKAIAPHWWVLLLSGIVSVAFGVAALYYYPALSLSFAVAWTALWLVFVGALGAWVSFQERALGVSWGWTMALGVLGIIGGVLAFMYPGVTLAWLLSLIAAFAFIGGVFMLVGAWRLQSFEHKLGARAGNALDNQIGG